MTNATYSDQGQPLGWTYGNSTTASFDYYDTTTTSGYDALVQSLQPLAWWKLQEAQGSLANEGSLAGLTGTPLGTPVYRVAGPSSAIPYAAQFNGSNATFDLDGDTSALDFERTQPFSAVGWIRKNAHGSWSALWGKMQGGGPYRGWEVLWVGNQVRVQLIHACCSNALGKDTTVAPSYGTWHLVAFTYDGSSTAAGLKVYVDGVAAATTTTFGALNQTTKSGVSMFLGSRQNSEGYVSGDMAQVAVFDQVLTAQQLADLYAAGTGGGGGGGELDPDGVAQPQDYRLKQLTYRDSQSSLLQQQSYRYDRVGNITGWWQQDRTTGPWRWDATYDERDRLTSAVVTNPPAGASPTSFSYAYNSIGNLTSGPLGTYTYGDAAHVHAATAAGSNSYTYDANGAVLTRNEGGTSYAHGYDVQGRQTSVAVGGTTTGFVYNGDGALVAKQVAGTTVAHYAAGGLYERDPTTGVTRKYATFGGRRIALTESPGVPGGGTALSFDGGTEHATADQINLDNNSFSIELWLYADDLAASRRFFGIKEANSTRKHLHLGIHSAGGVQFRFYNDDLNSSSGQVSAATWTHIVFTYDAGSNARVIYVNGSNIANDTAGGAFNGQSATTHIGRDGDGNNWLGAIDELQIYYRALGASEVVYRYNGGQGRYGYREPDLAAGWHFDEGGGTTAADYSGNGKTATLVNGTSRVPSSQAERGTTALTFDGSDDYVSVPSIAFDNRSFTVEAWLKPAVNPPTNQAWFNARTSDAARQNLHLFLSNDGRAHCAYYHEDLQSSNGTITFGTWHHVVCVYDQASDTTTLYVNGVAVAGGNQGPFEGTAPAVLLGAYSTGGSTIWPFQGEVDEVRVWHAARSAAEIRADMYRTLTGSEPGRVGYWRLDEATGTSATDATGSGNDGTLTNGPAWVTSTVPEGPTALSFDGVDDYATAPSIALDNRSFSVAFWVYPTSLATNGMVFNARTADTTRQNLHIGLINGGIVRCGYWGDDLDSPTPVPGRQWTQVVCSYDVSTDTSRLYLNGVEVASGSQGPFEGVSPVVNLGRHLSGTQSYLAGRVDELQVYTKTLSASEVRDRYDGGRGSYGYPEPNLVAGWHFDEGGGTTAADYSGNGNAATLQNGLAWTTSPLAEQGGTALHLDGANQSQQQGQDASVPSMDLANRSFSLEAWVYPGANPTVNGQIFSARSADSTQQSIHLVLFTNGNLRFGFYNDDLDTTTTPIQFESWNHVVATYDYGADTSRVYVNGSQVATGSAGPMIGTNPGVRLGSYASAQNSYLKGSLDEVRVYTKALSAGEVGERYHGGRGWYGYPEPNLLAGWHFDAGGGTTAADYSGNGYTATLQNSPSWVSSSQAALGTTALAFDGTDDYVSAPSIAFDNRSFTIEAWLRPEQKGEGHQLYFNARTADATRQNLHLRLWNSGAIQYGFYADDLTSPAGSVTFGTWNHVAATYDQPTDTSRIYVNGVEVASGNQGPFEGLNPATFLGSWRGNSQHFQGELDAVRVWHVARSAGDIRADMHRTLTGNEPGLVASWRLDEASGATATDATGNGHDGTLTNGPAWVTSTVLTGPTALALDGSNDYATAPSIELANRSFSVEAWIQPEPNPPATQTYWSAHAAVSTRQNLQLQVHSNGTIRFGFFADDLDSAAGAITFGRWQHVVHVYDQDTDTARIYVDGVQVANGSQGPFEGTAPNLALGASWFGPGDYFQGGLDEVRVYTRALGAGEVATRYAQGRGQYGSPERDLVAGWHFDEASGTTATDYSGNGRTATLQNGASWTASTVAVGVPQTQYLHQDHLGTTSLQTTQSGAFAGASFHAPFGDRWHEGGALASSTSASQSTATSTDHRYTGQRSLEGPLGSLYHYRARWYSPVLGRFLSPDPIVPEPGNPQAFNRYSYVYNNPLKYVDADGHAAVLVIPAVIIAAPVIKATFMSVALVITAVAADHAADELIDRMTHADDDQQISLADAGGQPATPPGQDPDDEQRNRNWYVGETIKAYNRFQQDRPLEQGRHVHHLVEKRFWQQLGFGSEEEGRRDILGVEMDADLHGPRADWDTITGRLRQRIGHDERATSTASLQQIWEAHRDVYREFDLEHLSEAIWEEYFRGKGVSKG